MSSSSIVVSFFVYPTGKTEGGSEQEINNEEKRCTRSESLTLFKILIAIRGGLPLGLLRLVATSATAGECSRGREERAQAVEGLERGRLAKSVY